LPREKAQFGRCDLSRSGVKDVNNDQSEDHDQDAAILNFDVDDVAIEVAATGVGTIPTASVNLVPPNCCVQQKR
jgi:hypothetical protein